jgi:hypothetical protein
VAYRDTELTLILGFLSRLAEPITAARKVRGVDSAGVIGGPDE